MVKLTDFKYTARLPSSQRSSTNCMNIFALKPASAPFWRFDANGQEAWESFATDTSRRRPTMLMISNSTDILLDNFKARNPQGVFYSVGSQSARIAYWNLDLSAVSSSSTQPKNTDGFDIGDSTYVTVDSVNVVNQDDCIAFKAGLNYLTVQNITCDGSHGLSVGSLAKYADNVDTVQNVYVRGAVMKNSTKAAGIKIYPGGTEHGYGIVTNVTWEDITVDSCDYACGWLECGCW